MYVFFKKKLFFPFKDVEICLVCIVWIQILVGCSIFGIICALAGLPHMINGLPEYYYVYLLLHTSLGISSEAVPNLIVNINNESTYKVWPGH